MPTLRIMTLNRERSVATLARRMFVIKDGRAGSADLARAEAAILRANPGLSKREGFTSGATIVVPARTGLRRREEVVSAEASGEGLGEEIGLRLQTAGAHIQSRFAASDERLKELLAETGEAQFRSEARRAQKEAGDALTRVRRNLARQAERSEETRRNLDSAVAEARKAFTELQGLIRPRTTTPRDDPQ